MRETVDEKARRYLAEGRITVVYLTGSRLRAEAHGSRRDTVERKGEGRSPWVCSCRAYKRCAHLAAVELVTP